jgi:hypothetical protein
MVAARHLHHYGYEVAIVFPERPRGPQGELQPWKGLQQQLRNLGVQVDMIVERSAILVN